MRTNHLSLVFISLIVFTGAPVFAADEGTTQQAQATVSTELPATDNGGVEMQEYTCPNCGKTFSVGRHGDEGGPVKCPYCGAECAEEKGFCLGADAGFFSKYVSRGLMYTDGPVFQPDVWASYKGFTLSIWGSMDMTDKNRLSGDFSEFDYTFDYSNSLGKLSYSAGAIYYNYLNTTESDTAEVYAGISYDVLLKPKLVVYYDFWMGDGIYALMSISHSFKMLELVKGIKSSLDLTAQVGLSTKNDNEYNFGDSHDAFTDYVLTAAIPVSLTDNFTIKPTVSYSSVLDRTIRSKNRLNDNVIFGGVVSASF